jgi:hypothetical protein
MLLAMFAGRSALGACYVASWQLPRLDSHRLADDSLAGYISELVGGGSSLRTYSRFHCSNQVFGHLSHFNEPRLF